MHQCNQEMPQLLVWANRTMRNSMPQLLDPAFLWRKNLTEELGILVSGFHCNYLFACVLDIIAVSIRLMLPHWSVHVSFGLNLGQIGGSEPKILGSCHPQTGGWSGQEGPAHVSLSQSGPPLPPMPPKPNKQTQTQPLVRRLSLVFPLHLQQLWKQFENTNLLTSCS